MPQQSALRQAILAALAVVATSSASAAERDCPSGTLYSRSLDGMVECVRATAAGNEPNAARGEPSPRDLRAHGVRPDRAARASRRA